MWLLEPFYFSINLVLIIALFSLLCFSIFLRETMSITSPRFKQFPAKIAVPSDWSPPGPAPYSFTYDNLLKCLYLRNESRGMRTPDNISDSALQKGNNNWLSYARLMINGSRILLRVNVKALQAHVCQRPHLSP